MFYGRTPPSTDPKAREDRCLSLDLYTPCKNPLMHLILPFDIACNGNPCRTGAPRAPFGPRFVTVEATPRPGERTSRGPPQLYFWTLFVFSLSPRGVPREGLDCRFLAEAEVLGQIRGGVISVLILILTFIKYS